MQALTPFLCVESCTLNRTSLRTARNGGPLPQQSLQSRCRPTMYSVLRKIQSACPDRQTQYRCTTGLSFRDPHLPGRYAHTQTAVKLRGPQSHPVTPFLSTCQTCGAPRSSLAPRTGGIVIRNEEQKRRGRNEEEKTHVAAHRSWPASPRPNSPGPSCFAGVLSSSRPATFLLADPLSVFYLEGSLLSWPIYYWLFARQAKWATFVWLKA